MGVPLAIQGFTALVIGGVGRVEGALLGGLLLAFAEQLTVRYAPIPSGLCAGRAAASSHDLPAGAPDRAC